MHMHIICICICISTRIRICICMQCCDESCCQTTHGVSPPKQGAAPSNISHCCDESCCQTTPRGHSPKAWERALELIAVLWRKLLPNGPAEAVPESMGTRPRTSRSAVMKVFAKRLHGGSPRTRLHRRILTMELRPDSRSSGAHGLPIYSIIRSIREKQKYSAHFHGVS